MWPISATVPREFEKDVCFAVVQFSRSVMSDFATPCTADGDCSHEIMAMINLDSILKIRDITLPTKVHLVKTMVFPVVMNECKSWTIKKAECRRIDAFELWCWRRLLRVP